ncbi:MAG: zinc ribbon domain-containing protein [Legionellaceae bacterium]|nr:zinc ribbon domain-containing protein [Legionellaceae bacterium]
MPIYEYKCSECGHEYEIIQKMSDDPVVECEKCHKPSAVRLVSAAGFQLKGTGWYETDFKHKGTPKEKTAVTETTSTSSAADTAKSTTKDEKK